MGDAPEQPDAGHGDCNDEDVKRPRGGESRAMNTLQSVLAAGHCGPFECNLEGDLGKGEREQREVQSPPAQDDRADREREQSRKDGREHERHEVVAVAAEDEERGRIARAAEEYGGAEWHEAGVTDQQIHARAVERVDRDLRDQRDRCTEQRPGRAQRSEHKRSDDRRMT